MKNKRHLIYCLILSLSGLVFGADVILNEYNAVAGSQFLNGGDYSADSDSGRASDAYFGRVQGNGGDWFELVVITDHLDMRNWRLDIYDSGAFSKTLTLTNHSIWSDLRSGTIITISENMPSDINYNPAAGDWWINVQANDNADGLYITAANFVVTNSDWQLRIRDAALSVRFGPAGEGISPASGISDIEIFRLEADPSASITPSSTDYDDGSDFSTFGSSNRWGQQSFTALRTVPLAASTITLLSPNGTETLIGGKIFPIQWQTTGPVGRVVIELSTDFGQTWSQISPANLANTGRFDWLVPVLEDEQCIMMISNADNPAVYDVSDYIFFIYNCVLPGDLTGDCIVDLFDFAELADDWLGCANPYDIQCQ